MQNQEYVVDADGWIENPIFKTFEKVVGVFNITVSVFPKSTRRRIPYVTWLIQSEAIQHFQCAMGECPSVEQAKAVSLRMAKHLESFTCES